MKKLYTVLLAAALFSTPIFTNAQTCADLYGPGYVLLRLDITSDDYPGETSFELRDACTGDILIPDGYYYLPDPNTSYFLELCVLNTGHYEFIIHDAFGDGICCSYGTGSYSLTYDGTVVRMGGAFGASESTVFGSSEPCPPPPPTPANDLCEDAVAITCGTTQSGTTLGATLDNGADCDFFISTGGVWYKWTGTGELATVSTCGTGTDYDTKLLVFTGSCAGLACLTGNDDDFSCSSSFLSSTASFCSEAGTDYYILVHGFGSAKGNFDLSLTCSPVTSNDNICSAQSLTLGTATPFNNMCATVEQGEPSPGAGTAASSCSSLDGWCAFETGIQATVWFTFVAPASGSVSISSSFDGPFGDTQLALWASNGGCSGTLTEVAANDDTPFPSGFGDFSSYIVGACGLTAGQTYYVQVDGFNGQMGTGTILVSDAGGAKVLVCHKRPRKSDITNEISVCALPAHLAHGDAIGACASFKTDETVVIEEGLFESFVNAYPNPFSDKTTIEFTVAEDSKRAVLSVYNLSGQLVAVLFDKEIQADNTYQVEFAPGSISGNMFIYRLQTDTENYMGKLSVAK